MDHNFKAKSHESKNTDVWWIVVVFFPFCVVESLTENTFHYEERKAVKK